MPQKNYSNETNKIGYTVLIPRVLRKMAYLDSDLRLKTMRAKLLHIMLTLTLLSLPFFSLAADHPLAGIPLRNIGPALVSGRVSDFAFVPGQAQSFYVSMASGSLWKTENNGITWTALFENENSFAIGVVEIDPSNPNIVWVGSGENNAQRSVGYGDGVYKSVDGGKSWKNMGLNDSGHISMIRFKPGDSNTIYVAAQGPLWNPGGDRGLYRSTDGGANWKRILDIDENTGINEFVIDPANPDVIVASSYQRRRHVWTLINGGPGSGIHKTIDGGISSFTKPSMVVSAGKKLPVDYPRVTSAALAWQRPHRLRT